MDEDFADKNITRILYNKKGEYVKISEMCLESYPCQHYIKIMDGKEYLLDGLSIYDYLIKNKYKKEDFKHFQMYENYGENCNETNGWGLFD